MSPAQTRIAEELVDQARALDVLTVLRRHSNVVLHKQRRELVGPCPRCGGTDRFAIRGQLFNCRGCGTGGKGPIDLEIFLAGGEFVDAVKRLVGEAEAGVTHASHAPPAKAAKEDDEYEAQQHRKAAWMWSQRRPIAGTPAEAYLRRRGITCTLPAMLGFLPPSKPGHHPAMIAAFAFVLGEPKPGILGTARAVQSVHLTLLKPDGGKADVPNPKLMVGSPSDLPIVLAPPNDLLGLAITEGIEDAITVHEATGLGVWAAGAAGRMSKLAPLVPSYIEAMTIYAHDDQVGRQGAHELAQALARRNRDKEDPFSAEVRMEGLS